MLSILKEHVTSGCKWLSAELQCLQTVGSRLSISESSRYPILAEYRAILSGSKDIEGYLNVDPVSILKCVPDTTYHAAKLLHKDGSLDSLAMLTAVTVQAALALDAAVCLSHFWQAV